jgi:hypothetical protein
MSAGGPEAGAGAEVVAVRGFARQTAGTAHARRLAWDGGCVAGSERDETPTERSDRNWNELLQELRVTQTGIQILSGFLLTLPFQARFSSLDGTERRLFLLAVVSSTIATGLVVAPVSAHRIFFRQHEKRALVTMSDRMAKVGLAALAVTVSTVLALIFSVVVGDGTGGLLAVLALVFFVTVWVVLPVVVLRRQREDDDR